MKTGPLFLCPPARPAAPAARPPTQGRPQIFFLLDLNVAMNQICFIP